MRFHYRENRSFLKKVTDALNIIPGDRMDLKRMPEELLAYMEHVDQNAVGSG